MYTLIVVLFLIGCCMIAAGLLGQAATAGTKSWDAGVASAMALMVVFALLLIGSGSLAGLGEAFGAINNSLNIPFFSQLADYGTMRNLFQQAPLEAAAAFLDTVFLAAIINMLGLLHPNSSDVAGQLAVKILTAVVLAIVGLVILNFVVKQSGPYQLLTGVLGAVIALISVGTVPLAVWSLIKQNSTAAVGIAAALLVFSQSRLGGCFRSALFQAVVYVGGVYVLEERMADVSAGLSQASLIITAFMPVIIMLIGIFILVKSVFK